MLLTFFHPVTESDIMKDTIIDVLFAVALGLVLCGFALAYFDVLTYWKTRNEPHYTQKPWRLRRHA
jgi:hypothetical protein